MVLNILIINLKLDLTEEGIDKSVDIMKSYNPRTSYREQEIFLLLKFLKMLQIIGTVK